MSAESNAEGPPLERLTRRLAECPVDFLAEPFVGDRGRVRVASVVADLAYDLGAGLLAPRELAVFAPPQAADRRAFLRTVLVACWLLHDEWFLRRQRFGPMVLGLLNSLAELSALTSVEQLVTDPDRREELARLVLAALALHPAGESEAQAQDRLTTLSTVERQRVIRATRGAQERAQMIRDAMAKKAAEEAAAKYARE